jgi:hypothetical protein
MLYDIINNSLAIVLHIISHYKTYTPYVLYKSKLKNSCIPKIYFSMLKDCNLVLVYLSRLVWPREHADIYRDASMLYTAQLYQSIAWPRVQTLHCTRMYYMSTILFSRKKLCKQYNYRMIQFSFIAMRKIIKKNTFFMQIKCDLFCVPIFIIMYSID